MDGAALHLRLRAMCCAEWGMAPGRFEAAAARGEVALEDVLELFFYRASEPVNGARLMPYLFREREKSKGERLARAQFLMLRARATKDPAERAKIAKQLEAINSGH